MKRWIAAIIACACVAGMVGCDNNSKYSIKTDQTLTYWMGWSDIGSTAASSMQMTEFSKGLEERTGIKVEYIHPNKAGGLVGSFEVMISSNNLPDIIEMSWEGAPGGALKQLNEQKIIDLSPLLEKYAPDYKGFLEEHDDARQIAILDNGQCPYFIGGYAEDYQTVFFGPFFRKDWLDELGLELPETIDEWEIALRAFKEQKGAEAPLGITPDALGINALIGAYGVQWRFYQDNGQVKFGPFEPGFRDFVERMAKWYQEGLIDPMYPFVSYDIMEMNLFEGKTGAGFCYLGADLGPWQKKIEEEQLQMRITSVKNPSLKKGETTQIAPRDPKYIKTYGAAVSAGCKSPQLAVQFLNYAYTEEGNRYFNFGEEGVSYTMQNGIPTYSALITDNPDMSMGTALAMYTRTSYGGPFIKDAQYTIQYYRTDLQKEALDKWGDNNAAQHILPQIEISYENAEQLSQNITKAIEYQNQTVTKFIIGEIPLSQYDQFVQTLRAYGMEEVIRAMQKSYDTIQKS